jgi:hypothetical protein
MWLPIVTVLMAVVCAGVPFARARAADNAAQVSVDYVWVDALERRIDRLLPSLLTSLWAVRREREPALVRCFDRAVSELNSVARQVAYHADRLEDVRERVRHQKALLLLNTRVEDLARTRVDCFTDGAVVAAGKTSVEVVYVP